MSVYDESIIENRTRFRAKEIEIFMFFRMYISAHSNMKKSLNAVSLITSFLTLVRRLELIST